ncbi:MAG: Hsp33 family molecular chaperone HslO [Thermaerobacter sp.]|nr:Hsp33 family molecular chaperone HslO [Thermaerobacter sp.]
MIGNPRGDYRIRATAAGGQIRAMAAITTQTARTAQLTHAAFPTAAAAMGRTLTAAVLLGFDVKHEAARVTVEVEGGGPLGRVVAEVRGRGLVRARVTSPQTDPPRRSDGKLNVGHAVGSDGFLRVTRDMGGTALYQGQVALVSGEIGEDLTHYYLQSEQVASAVSLGVLIGRDAMVAAAGGVVVQAMPAANPDLVSGLSEAFTELAQISRQIDRGMSPESLLAKVLPTPIRWHGVEPVAWQCRCSQARSYELLSSLPRADIEALIAEGGAQITCNFCRSAYRVPAADLKGLAPGR